jgi:mRNA interferase MazF
LTPDRGDLIVLDFDPQVGREQMKRRPALVLSSGAFNDAFKVAYVAPITTKPRGNAFEVPLPPDGRVRGAVLMSQMKSLDWRGRRARPAGKAPAAVVAAAVEIMHDILEG